MAQCDVFANLLLQNVWESGLPMLNCPYVLMVCLKFVQNHAVFVSFIFLLSPIIACTDCFIIIYFHPVCPVVCDAL